jgi:drug/metabolite transporter (DMT)-like permease
MGIFLGLLAAVSFGIADFLARFSTKLVGTYRTLLYMQLIGLVGLSLYGREWGARHGPDCIS